MQATRRTTLSRSSSSTGRFPRRATLALVVAAVALIADVVSKHLAEQHLEDGQRVRVLGDLVEFVLVRNPGAAFSTGSSYTVFITAFALAAAVVVTWFVFRVRHRGWAVTLGLLLAGVLGNLGDRLFRSPGAFRGHVVDFIALPHWPVFNLADVCIDVAGVLLVILVLRRVRLDGTRAED